MRRYPKPNRKDYEKFLIQIVYRPYEDYLLACVKTSYRDFCRTMHGLSKLQARDSIYKQASTSLTSAFRTLSNETRILDQPAFDKWHERTSNEIVSIFDAASFPVFAGQTQKWINMTFKSVFVCGDDLVPGFGPFYDHCHMPIDNVILDQLEERRLPRPPKAWSRWDYPEYYEFQNKLRSWCDNQPLLNVEH